MPSFAREVDIIKEIASLLAEPVKVDEFSLLKDQPIRVRVNCRDPSKLRAFVEIFFNGVGYEIKIVVEGGRHRILANEDSQVDQGRSNDRQGGRDGQDQGKDKGNLRG